MKANINVLAFMLFKLYQIFSTRQVVKTLCILFIQCFLLQNKVVTNWVY